MIRKRRLLVNAGVAAGQVVVIGGTFFVLYRFLRDEIGAADFGVWALVLATTSAGSIANLGLAASAVKFVSQYLARGQRERVAQIVQTAALSVGGFLGLVLGAAFPLLDDLLALLVEPADKLPAALSILPYALASFWLSSVAGVFLSCLDGFQRVDLRGMLLSAAALAYLALAFVLVPEGGLIGIAQAQVIQAGALLAASWIVLRRLLPALPPAPYRWRRDAFREMLGYSLNFQVISAGQLLLEPTVKALVSRFGGVGMLANFEFAYRMVVQVRALIATAHQAVVPTIADLQERDPAQIRAVYKKSYHLVAYLLAAALPFLVAVTPLVSRLWIGVYEPQFVLFGVLLFVGWFVNLAANPAYFANLGTGALRWNVVGHVVMGVLSAGLGLVLGWRFGGPGVVVGFVTALVAGSLTISVAYERHYGIRLAELLQGATLRLGAASLAGMALALVLYFRLDAAWNLGALSALVVGVYAAFVVVPLWRHPMRRQVGAWLAHLRPARPAAPHADPP